ncbi:hypothetical protein [Mariniradius sediminis]|uniref:Lipoprotein n=1 Tax=Mariniradius sediminis TaxID=2909237 RepID=A0ABS9BXL2_9BACT|nr:hypothetical protein [Mariniradius sediminis]MCF1752029.1 hypothetical protein [Mariniradius sediminis]
MKMRKTIWIALFGLFGMGLFSCENEPETPTDPLFEQQVFAVSEVMFQRFLMEINLSFFKGLSKNDLIGDILLNPAEVDCANTTYIWNPAARTMTIDYGQSCTPSTGFRKSGKIVISMPSGSWTVGSSATLTFENLIMEQRKFEGSIKIDHGNIVFGATYRQTTSYQNLRFTHEDNQVSTLSGNFSSQVNIGEVLTNFDITGQGTGNYKGIGNFQTNVTAPLEYRLVCRDLGNNGFAKGVLESTFAATNIQTTPGTGPQCSESLTIRIGDQIRTIAF